MLEVLREQVMFLLSRGSLVKLSQNFLTIFGIIWLFVESSSFFFSDYLNGYRVNVFILSSSVSLIISILLVLPKSRYIRRFKSSGLEIEVKVGDLLEEFDSGNSDIVVGINNYLTPLANRQVGQSLKSQIAIKYYQSRWDRLDRDIVDSLNESDKQLIDNSQKVYKASIGSVAAVKIRDRKIFFLINQEYQHQEGLKNISKQNLWFGLCNLWDVVKNKGNNYNISIPVLGSGLGRAPAFRLPLIQLILISFMISSREALISRRLTIVIQAQDYNPEEMSEIISFIERIN
jgi:hypothetical protein